MSKPSAEVFPAALYETYAGPLGEAMNRYRRAMVKAVADWQQEVARFVGQRAEHDRRTAQSAARCDSLRALLDLQQSWAREAAADYIEEARKLQTLSTEITRAAWTPLSTWLAESKEGRGQA